MSSDQKRAFLAIILSGVVLFGWQFYFAPKKETTSTNIQAPTQKLTSEQDQSKVKLTPVKQPVETQSVVTKADKLANNDFSYSIDNHLSLLNADNSAAKFSFVETMGNTNPINIYVLKNGVKHQVNIVDFTAMNNTLKGNDAAKGIDVEYKLHDNGLLSLTINSSDAYKFLFELSPSTDKESTSKGDRQFITFSKEMDRFDFDDDEVNEKFLSWFALDYNYHIIGITFPEKIPLRYAVKENPGLVRVETVESYRSFSLNYIFTDKNYDKLANLGTKLELSVDYGVFGILAVPILKTLQFIHKYIPNYGVAIIILTLILRLLLYPLQVKSFKSMKKMQLVQPEVKLIKEKYKEDPKRQQQETMALFKRAGANPLGGCLPLLLQMPFFFAIFQVLRNSIELVNAPFLGWISDLSAKDPYYILPVLMCLAMLIQQKVTPSPSADPAQKKMMMIMPLVFGFIMKDLPSGLCLYIFISTLFGFGQQMLVYKFTN